MVQIKLGSKDNVDKTEIENQFYDGPPPPAGPYTGVVKFIKLGKTGPNSQNPGSDKLDMLVEINKGKYKGAGIFHTLNFSDKGVPRINEFLHALTDGTDAEMVRIRRVFWERGGTYDDKNPDKNERIPLTNIGKKYNFSNELEVGFVTRMGEDNKTGADRAEISRFVIKKQDDEEPEIDEDDDLGGVVDEDAEDDVIEDDDDETAADDDDDDDSPWDDDDD